MKKATLIKAINEGRIDCYQDVIENRHIEIRWTRTGKKEVVFIK